jgi:hypothetical protein
VCKWTIGDCGTLGVACEQTRGLRECRILLREQWKKLRSGSRQLWHAALQLFSSRHLVSSSRVPSSSASLSPGGRTLGVAPGGWTLWERRLLLREQWEEGASRWAWPREAGRSGSVAFCSGSSESGGPDAGRGPERLDALGASPSAPGAVGVGGQTLGVAPRGWSLWERRILLREQ